MQVYENMKRLKLSRQFDNIMDEIQRDGHDIASKAVIDLPINKLKRGIYQPREIIEHDQELKELAESISEHGILQPIIVRECDEHSYEIIAGERRARAAEFNQMLQVPAIVEQFDDHKVAVLTLIENIQRKDLNPIEEAIAYQKLIDEFRLTHDEVAKRVGKPRTTISNFLRLLRLAVPVKKLLSKKKLEMGHAKVLLTLEEKEQITTGQLIINKGLSVRQTEKIVREQKYNNKLTEQSIDFELLKRANNLKNDFSQFIGKSIDLKLRNKHEEKGQLKITFNSLDELEHLLKSLKDKVKTDGKGNGSD